jgi:hypothetical protein
MSFMYGIWLSLYAYQSGIGIWLCFTPIGENITLPPASAAERLLWGGEAGNKFFEKCLPTPKRTCTLWGRRGLSRLFLANSSWLSNHALEFEWLPPMMASLPCQSPLRLRSLTASVTAAHANKSYCYGIRIRFHYRYRGCGEKVWVGLLRTVVSEWR